MKNFTRLSSFAIVAALLLANLPAPAFSQSASATKSAELQDANNDGFANPGERIDYEVTITAEDGTVLNLDFEDILDGKTMLDGLIRTTPLAIDDSYEALGNTPIVVSAEYGVLSNDIDPENLIQINGVPQKPGAEPNTGLTVTSVSGVSAGAAVAFNGDGSFTYSPPVGFTGVDTFTYAVSDGDSTAEAVVSIEVSGMIWYVDNQAAAGGDGSQSRPFQSIAALQSAGTAQAGDVIFFYEGGGEYEGALTLANHQRVIGQGASLSAFLPGGGPLGVSLPPVASNPVLTNGAANGIAISLASNNTLAGVTVGNTPGGVGISGTNFGVLTIDQTVAINGTGGTLRLSNGHLEVALAELISTATLGGIAGAELTSVSGTLSVSGGTSFSGGYGAGIKIANAASATVFDFGSANLVMAGNANAIDITNSPGSATIFASLAASTFNGIGFRGDQMGTVSIGGSANVITASGNAALSISGGVFDGGITFASLSSNNSATNGIRLINVSGGVTVTGDGSLTLNHSGGTIQNSASHGIQLQNSPGLTLRSMRIVNAGGDAVNTSGGGDYTFSAVYIDFPGAYGWRAIDLGGINAVDNDSMVRNFNSSDAHAVLVRNHNTNLDSLTFNAITVRDQATSNGAGAVVIEALGSSSIGLVVEGGCVFENLRGEAIILGAGSTGTISADIQHSTFRNSVGSPSNGGLLGNVSGNGWLDLTFKNNVLHDLGKQLAQGAVVSVGASESGGMHADISNNTIYNIPDRGAIWIAGEQQNPSGNPFVGARINNNTIDAVGHRSIFVRAMHDTPNMHVEVLNNMIGTTTRVGTAPYPGGGNYSSVLAWYQNNAQLWLHIEGNTVRANSNTKHGDPYLGFGYLGVMSITYPETVNGNAKVHANVLNNTIDNTGTMLTFEADHFATGPKIDLQLNGNTVSGPNGRYELYAHTVASDFRLTNRDNVNAANTGSVIFTGSQPAHLSVAPAFPLFP